MPQEIITLLVGQCANQICVEFCKQLCAWSMASTKNALFEDFTTQVSVHLYLLITGSLETIICSSCSIAACGTKQHETCGVATAFLLSK
jgi:hypothetical protein